MRALTISAVLLLVNVGVLMGEVVSKADHGFSTRSELTIESTPRRVFEALVKKVDHWWDSSHTFSGDAGNLSIDPRPGGCFCERLKGRNGTGGVVHLTVVNVEPDRMLRLVGGLGPLQEWGIAGALSFTLEAAGDATDLVVTYNVSGYHPNGLGAWAAAVDRVVGEQAERLKAYVEGRTPAK